MAHFSTKHMLILVFAASCILLLTVMRVQKPPAATTTPTPESPMELETIQPKQELHEIGSRAELEALLSKTDKPVVIKFFATWCPPCRAIKPIYRSGAEELAAQAYFAEIDIDGFADKEQLAIFNVQTIPTIIFFKQGTEVKRIQGLRNQSQLKEELASL